MIVRVNTLKAALENLDGEKNIWIGTTSGYEGLGYITTTPDGYALIVENDLGSGEIVEHDFTEGSK